MKIRLRITCLVILLSVLSTSADAALIFNSNDATVFNKLFQITIPKEFKGKYKAEIKSDSIAVYDKISRKAGFGGFAFAIQAYKNPASHAVMPGSVKIGELTDRKGELYDMVLIHPTDVQYDYTKNNKPPADFKAIYDLGDSVDIKGRFGSKYYKDQGMKGKDLYGKIIQKHITAILERWDSIRLENENMSYMYNVIPEDTNKLNKIGYTYYDINCDGIDELLIGEIAEGNWKGVIYDIYTMVNREPKHVISGGSRNRFYVCDGSFICNEYSGGAGESGTRVYSLVENSTELFPQVSFKYDIYSNKKNPWFISYGTTENKWDNVPENIYNERKSVFNSYLRFNYNTLRSYR